MAAPKTLDSMDPFVSVDPQEVRTDRTELAPAQAAKLEIVNADARLDVKLVGHSTLTMLAFVDDEGPFEALVSLKVDGNFASLTVNKAMSGVEMLEELTRNLPPGYAPATRESSQSDVLIVTVMRPGEEATEPEVSFLATDPSQLFRWEGKNKLRIEGRAARGLKLRSVIDLYIEGYRVKLPLGRGDFPISTAKRLRDALPKSFCGLIELPIQPGGDVTLTILRRR